MGQPFVGAVAAHGDGAVGAVPVVVEVVVVFHPAEEGEDAGVAPFVVAPFGPAVVVFRDAAVEYLAVDGGGAAGGLAAGDDQVGLLRRYPGAVGPAVGAVGGEEDVVAQLEVVGQVVEVGVVRAGFQQQDGIGGIFGKAGGDGGAGRTGANHDIVIAHRNLLAPGLASVGNSSGQQPAGQGTAGIAAGARQAGILKISGAAGWHWAMARPEI